MSSLMVASRSFTPGPEVSSAAAKLLGYEFVALEDLLGTAASSYGAPVDKLRAAMLRAPSLLGMAAPARRRLARVVLAACAARIARDQVVLHVPYAAFAVPGISHVARVRLTASFDARTRAAAGQLRTTGDRAEKRLRADDREGDAVATLLFGREDGDDAYDATMDTSGRSVEDAARLLASRAGERQYQVSTYSQRYADELAAARAIEATMAIREVDATVNVRDGNAVVRAQAAPRRRPELAAAVDTVAAQLPIFKKVDLLWVDDLFDEYAASMR